MSKIEVFGEAVDVERKEPIRLKLEAMPHGVLLKAVDAYGDELPGGSKILEITESGIIVWKFVTASLDLPRGDERSIAVTYSC